MPAINFRKRYAAAIESGVKRSTIRPPRKDGVARAKPGDVLSLYWGMRTKHCKLIRRVACESVEQIAMTIGADPGQIIVRIQGRTLGPDEVERLAIGEGFRDTVDMAAFFRNIYGTDMQGWLIRWNPETSPPARGGEK